MLLFFFTLAPFVSDGDSLGRHLICFAAKKSCGCDELDGYPLIVTRSRTLQNKKHMPEFSYTFLPPAVHAGLFPFPHAPSVTANVQLPLNDQKGELATGVATGLLQERPL